MAKSGKVDFRELREFQKQIQTQLSGQQLDLFMESCSKALARRLLERVIYLTPTGHPPKLQGGKTYKVKGKSGKTRSFLSADAARIQQYWSGYEGGTLKRGWTGGRDEDPEAYANSLNVQHSGRTYTINITNNVEYASYVEFGHRQMVGRYVPALGKKLKQGWVNGKFMLTKSEDALRKEAPKALERKLKKKINEVFK